MKGTDGVVQWLKDTLNAVTKTENADDAGGDDWLDPVETHEIDKQKDTDVAEKDETKAPTEPSRDEIWFMSFGNVRGLRNAQLRQLAREHPDNTNFYHLTLKIRQANENGDQDEAKKLMKLLYPCRQQPADNCENGQYRSSFSPETLAISLGQMKLATKLGPKPVFDPELCKLIKNFEVENEMRKASPVADKRVKYTSLLGKIEQLYRHFLDFEEAESRISLLQYRSDYDVNVKAESLKRAQDILLDYNLLRKILAVDKGKMVVCRTLPLLPCKASVEVLASFIDLIPEWKFDNEAKACKVYSCFMYCLKDTDERELAILLENMNKDIIKQLAGVEVGMSLLMVVLRIGQRHFNSLNDVRRRLEYDERWPKMFRSISMILSSLEAVTVPYEIFPGFLDDLKAEDFGLATDENIQFWEDLTQLFIDNGSLTNTNL